MLSISARGTVGTNATVPPTLRTRRVIFRSFQTILEGNLAPYLSPDKLVFIHPARERKLDVFGGVVVGLEKFSILMSPHPFFLPRWES